MSAILREGLKIEKLQIQRTEKNKKKHKVVSNIPSYRLFY